jgi:fructokinase
VLEADGTVSASTRIATPRNDYAGTIRAVAGLVEVLDPAAQMPVGIGTPGSWRASRGEMQNCNSTWLNAKPLLTDLLEALGGRVRMGNDADCFALSEAHDGAAAGARSVFGAILGTGVGGGIVVNGTLLEGVNGLAGEWGHNPLPCFPPALPDGVEFGLPARRCYCGRTNCIEAFLSGPGLARTHEQLWRKRVSPAAIYTAAELDGKSARLPPGDIREWRNPVDALEEARVSLAVYCRMLADCLATIVNVLDPQVIVLGGGLSNMTALYEPVQTLLAERVFGSDCATRITPPRFGDSSGVRGAAWLWD